MPQSQKMPFDSLPGLPSRDDQEVRALMKTFDRLPADVTSEVTRCLLRAALGHERTGDDWYLTRLAEDALFTMRLHGDATCGDVPKVGQPHLDLASPRRMDLRRGSVDSQLLVILNAINL